MLITRLLGTHQSGAVDDAVRQLTSIDWTGPRPALLGYAPVARGNPFQPLLYDRLAGAGIRPFAAYDVDTALEVTELIGHDVTVVTHLHWLSVATQGASSEAAARAGADSFLRTVEQIREQGGRVLWTVHNVLPHDSVFVDVDVDVRRRMCELADRIHVMSRRTRELCSPWFDLPTDKTFAVPHPSYHGAYPDHMSKLSARQRLGISPAAVVHVLFGAIKAYKGLPELVEAFDEVCSREPGRHVLLVAGSPDESDEAAQFTRWALRHPSVLADLRPIPVEDVQVYLRAADLFVMPYRRSLNSGALALAATFGLSAVIPASSGESGTELGGFALAYDSDSPGSLGDAMLLASRTFLSTEHRIASEAWSATNHRDLVATQFAGAVRGWLDSDG